MGDRLASTVWKLVADLILEHEELEHADLAKVEHDSFNTALIYIADPWCCPDTSFFPLHYVARCIFVRFAEFLLE